jgi:glycosyltransferase involved in cell wall biosynthesis
MKNKSKIFLLTMIIILIVLISYKIYAPYTIQDFKSVNLKNIDQIKEQLQVDNYSFAVVGNIENSISIFDKRIVNQLNRDNIDFILSTGNNLTDSEEDKYRVFYRTLQKLNIPFVSALGVNETKDEGYKNFYKYFGPFYFSFQIDNAYFIFLDTTGTTNLDWQRQWLETELKSAQQYKHQFIIMNKSALKVAGKYLVDDKVKYIPDLKERKSLQNIFAKYGVDAVFSSNLELFQQSRVAGVNYFITGGAGGELLVDDDNSYYHYLLVNIGPEGVSYQVKKVRSIPGPSAKFIVNIWVALQSFIYTNYLNILIVLFIGLTVFYILHREINKEVDYYRDFAYANNEFEKKKLNIAMFTNNYFPVIGGVPISIQRLAKALRERGHQVTIFAPKYKEDTKDEANIIRCSSIYYYQEAGLDFPVTNIFSPAIKKKFKAANFDVVHCHHPFWLGSRGRQLAQKSKLPTAFTYHTRLEKYAHYVPNILFLRKFFANRLSHFLIKNFANKTDAVFAPTDSTKEYLRNVGVSRHIKVMPTGIDFDYYQHKQSEIKSLRDELIGTADHLLISVSRLSKEKNLYFLLKGIKQLAIKTELNFKLIIIGSGSEKEDLEKYLIDNNLAERVELIGSVDFREMAKYYLAADLFVFASTTETQGMVLLEAMAGYNPVIAVKSSGIDDVIENNYNGFKTDENIEQWSNKIIELLTDKDNYQQTSCNARKMAENYSIENMALEAEELYYKIMQLNKYQ